MEDIFITTMLNSNIEEIKEQCFANRQIHRYCQGSYFWIEKFNHDRLPLLGELPKNINGWINRYNEILKLKHDAQDILMINQIESERSNNPLKIIMIPITQNKYHLVKEFFKKDLDNYDEEFYKELDDDFNVNYMYDISIVNSLDGIYEKIYTKINFESAEAIYINQGTDYNEILYLLISTMFKDPYYEILDQNSHQFFDKEENIMNYGDTIDLINGYKRIGIRESLKVLY